MENLMRWGKRNKQLAAFAVLMAAVILFALLGIAAALVQTNIARIEADEKANAAIIARKEADENLSAANVEKMRANEKANEAQSEKRKAEEAEKKAKEAAEQTSMICYQPLVSTAHQAYLSGNIPFAEAKMLRINPRSKGWEWQFVANLINGNRVEVKSPRRGSYPHFEVAHFTPDSSQLIFAFGGEADLFVYSTTDWSHIRTIRAHQRPENEKSSSPIADFFIDPSSTWVISKAMRFEDIVLSNIRSGEVIDSIVLAQGRHPQNLTLGMNSEFSMGVLGNRSSVQINRFSPDSCFPFWITDAKKLPRLQNLWVVFGSGRFPI